MNSLLHKVRSLLGVRSAREDRTESLEALLDRDFARLCEVDPNTSGQWLHLQRALAQQEVGLRRLQPRRVQRLAFGTALLVAAAVVVYLSIIPRPEMPDTFLTAKGEHSRILLRDSSEVTLNYATQLVVPKLQPGKPRHVSLIGEAYFNVRRNDMPFIVSTAYAEIHVVGTEFNVSAREESLEVSVIHGTVNISTHKDGKDSVLTLTQHQRAICSRGGVPRRLSEIPFLEYPGWLHGKLFLDGTPFAAACREIEMRFDVAITIRDERLRNEIVTGMLEAKTAESALAALCGLTGTRFRHDGQVFSIY